MLGTRAFPKLTTVGLPGERSCEPLDSFDPGDWDDEEPCPRAQKAEADRRALTHLRVPPVQSMTVQLCEILVVLRL